MNERSDPPPLHVALEIERLNSKLQAQEARIAELHGLLRPLAAKLSATAPASRMTQAMLIAPALACLLLAITVGALAWRQEAQIERLARTVAVAQAPAAQTAPTREQSHFELPALRPPPSRG
jgi:hypothetical protein